MKGKLGIDLRPYAFMRAVAAGLYVPDIPERGTLGKLILELKDRPDSNSLISEVVVSVFKEELCDLHFDIIIPVPTHDNGIGPSMAISEHLSVETGIPIVDIIRFHEGMQCSKDLSGDEKFDNAKEKVLLSDVNEIGSRSILLVDDILTTCGTAHWCSMELLKNGATSVHVLGALRNVRRSHLDFIGYFGRY